MRYQFFAKGSTETTYSKYNDFQLPVCHKRLCYLYGARSAQSQHDIRAVLLTHLSPFSLRQYNKLFYARLYIFFIVWWWVEHLGILTIIQGLRQLSEELVPEWFMLF